MNLSKMDEKVNNIFFKTSTLLLYMQSIIERISDIFP